ncbi:MAG: DEAD/DEAH box helicase, partial [Geminicoccaceae bacterium]
MRLRPYQQDIVEKLLASTALSRCIQSPTGSGKSVLIAHSAANADSYVAIAHREYLVDQLAEIMPDAQVIKAGVQWDRKSRKIIGMVQTLCRRDPEDLPKEIAQIIIDEHHHSTCDSYKRVIGYWSDATIDGYTGTPIRGDGTNLGDVSDELICGPQYRELIDDGYLKPFEVYSIPHGLKAADCKLTKKDYTVASQNDAIRRSTIFGDVVDHWRRFGRDGGHISFWPSVSAAEHACEGIKGWEPVHSKMPKDVVMGRIAALEAGTLDSLASCDLIGEGLNVRGIASVSRCRMTKSLGLYMQQCGRCNRGGEGVARVISHVDDWRVHHHGLPDDDREWSLEGRVKRRATPGMLSVWDCPACLAVCRSQAHACWKCGLEKPREIILMEERQAELQLIKSMPISEIHEHCTSGPDYVAFAEARGKKPSFGVLRYWQSKNHVAVDHPLADIMNQKPTLREFIVAAKDCGVSSHYAEEAGKKMQL